MLETIREYSRARLGDTASVELDVRHAAHFLALAIALDDVQRGADEQAVFDRLAADHDNIRAALARGIRFDPRGTGAPLVASMTRFWWIRGHIAEGRRWYSALLERREELSRAQLSLVLADDAFSAGEQEKWEEAATIGSEALAIARELDDPGLIGIALRAVATSYDEIGRSDDARAAYEEALALSRAGENRFSEAADTYNIGQWALEHGDPDRAHECFARALEISCELGTQEGIASSRLGLGYALRRQGRFEESIEALRVGLADIARLGFPARVLVGLLELAMALVDLGAPEKAATLFGAATSNAESLEMSIDQLTTDARIKLEAVLGDDLADAQSSGRLMSIDEAVEYALASLD
jgi:tetratricopeptide (TPR) repeat protein